MLYNVMRVLIRFLFKLLNGNLHLENQLLLPEGNYVLVGPHRTWWDPIIFALAASPKQFAFMAKQQLWRHRILGNLLNHVHAFSVDRKHPGPSAIRIPVRILKQTNLSVMIFPSGSRYSQQFKDGALLIAKLAHVPIVPVVYQGPLRFSQILCRQKITVRFGQPIMIPTGHLKIEETQSISDQIHDALNQLDHEIDPKFQYIPDQKRYM